MEAINSMIVRVDTEARDKVQEHADQEEIFGVVAVCKRVHHTEAAMWDEYKQKVQAQHTVPLRNTAGFGCRSHNITRLHQSVNQGQRNGTVHVVG